jgi:hypothetical protein
MTQQASDEAREKRARRTAALLGRTVRRSRVKTPGAPGYGRYWIGQPGRDPGTDWSRFTYTLAAVEAEIARIQRARTGEDQPQPRTAERPPTRPSPMHTAVSRRP